MRSRRVTRKDVLFLSISFFVVVTAWVGFNLYHTWVTTTISEDLQMQIIPIDPTFDTAVIDKLKTRKQVNPLFETDNITPATNAASLATPTILQPSPTLTLTPTPTEDASFDEDIIPTEIPEEGI